MWRLAFIEMDDEPHQNMAKIWECVKSFYSANATPTQYTSLTIHSFCDGNFPCKDWPKLKGSGAEVKDLLPAISDCWHEHARKDGAQLVSQALTSLEEVQTIFHDYAKDVILPLDVCDSLVKHTDAFLLTYQRLAAEAEAAGAMLWSCPTKFHVFHHLARRARYINPRKTNCFLDEDFVGKVKVLVHSCVHGSEQYAMTTKMMEKYRWLLHFIASDNV